MSSPPTTPARIARFWPLASAIAGLLLVALVAGVIVYREHNKPFGFELEWMSELVEHRSGFWTALALAFNVIGGGLIAAVLVPVGVALALTLSGRRWSALFFLVSTVASAAIVKILKQLLGRPRPEDILVSPDFGSFPSGHSANAAVVAVTLGIIFARTWVWAAGALYTVGMMVSRTYLGAHWVSDTVGGALIGAGVAVIVWAPLALKVHRERPTWPTTGCATAPASR